MMPQPRRSVRCLAAALLMSLLASAAAASEVTFETVVMSGDNAANAGDAVFARFSDPVINHRGHVAFRGELRPETGDVTIQNDQGVWFRDGTTGFMRMVAREGNQADDMPEGAIFQDFAFVTAAEQGFVGFIALLKHSVGGVRFVDNQGIWVGPPVPGELTLIVRKQGQPPQTPQGARFQGWEISNQGTHTLGFLLAANGAAALKAELMRPFGSVDRTNNIGIWTGPRDSIRLAARTGFPAPGMLKRSNWTDLGDPVINQDGAVAFHGKTQSADKAATKAEGIWITKGASTSIAIATGVPGPELPPKVMFESLGTPSINRHGRIAFRAGMSQGLITVYSDSSGTMRLYARVIPRRFDRKQLTQDNENDAMQFTDFEPPLLSDGGHVLVLAKADGGRAFGMWVSDRDSRKLNPVARLNAPVAGLASATAEGEPIVFRGFTSLAMNESGQVAMLCDLTTADEGARVNRGIFFWDKAAGLRPIVQVGDDLPIRGDTTKRVAWVSAITTRTGGGDGRPNFLNNGSVIAFRAGFYDHSEGIFLARVPDR